MFPSTRVPFVDEVGTVKVSPTARVLSNKAMSAKSAREKRQRSSLVSALLILRRNLDLDSFISRLVLDRRVVPREMNVERASSPLESLEGILLELRRKERIEEHSIQPRTKPGETVSERLEVSSVTGQESEGRVRPAIRLVYVVRLFGELVERQTRIRLSGSEEIRPGRATDRRELSGVNTVQVSDSELEAEDEEAKGGREKESKLTRRLILSYRGRLETSLPSRSQG